jgi:hypothetical protein
MRKAILVATLILSIAAWAELSIHSPVRGWARGVVTNGYVRLYRLTAHAPCSRCEKESGDIGGITVTHPKVLDHEVKFPRDKYSSLEQVLYVRKQCGLLFSI